MYRRPRRSSARELASGARPFPERSSAVATQPQPITGTDFVGFPTRDLEAAAEFYGDTLGLRRSVYIPDRNYAEFETGNLTLSLYNPEKMGMEHNRNPNPIGLH